MMLLLLFHGSSSVRLLIVRCGQLLLLVLLLLLVIKCRSRKVKDCRFLPVMVMMLSRCRQIFRRLHLDCGRR
uniref:Putative secreted protein n=1 Tax=Anopheles darlingi TaxID=43151 RepID=A0A2M4DGK3_ANODA